MDTTPIDNPQQGLARAIKRRDWERAALYMLLFIMDARAENPTVTVDDLVDALDLPEDTDAERPGR